MSSAPRLPCALVAALCGAAAIIAATSGTAQGTLEQRLPAILTFAAASGLAGAWILPKHIAPRHASWLRAAGGGLLVAPVALALSTLLDLARRAAHGLESLENAIFVLLIGAIYAAAMGAPFFVAGALALHVWMRRR